MLQIRRPAVAGLFYPADPQRLLKEVKTILSIVPEPAFSGEIFGIVVPHAGYIYSGKTAAYAFNLLKKQEIRTVIVISPSHREYFPGVSVYDGDAYETPLGVIEVDKELAENLASGSKDIDLGKTGHMEEHAIEVELPFLQTVLGKFRIVPVVMGDQKPRYINELARKLADVYDSGVLLVASSDLSHYHSRQEAEKLDSIVEERIGDFDYEKLMIDLEVRNCEACGGGPVVALMKAASLRRFNKSLVLNRSDSGDTSGNFSEVVGYLSAVIYR